MLKARFDLIQSLSAVLTVLGFGLILVIAGFYFIQTAQNRIEKGILKPLLNKLLSNEEMEIAELNDLREKIRNAQVLEAQKAVTLAIQEHNQQVAHDIRGPLASINELINLVEIRDAKISTALSKALARANTVASDLLSAEQKPSQNAPFAAYDLATVAHDIATEKRPLFLSGSIVVECPEPLLVKTGMAHGILSRLLSNLVDNAMLACDETKKITLSVSADGGQVKISIRDTGRGIAADVLSRLGEKGFSVRSSAQPKGTGRGVYAAKKALTAIGGSIEFRSALGSGTEVVLTIPTGLQAPTAIYDLILVDNEEVIRLTWAAKAEAEQKRILLCASVDELLAHVDIDDKTIPVFLDSDLGNHQKGELRAQDLYRAGFKRIHLTTAYDHLQQMRLPFIESVVDKRFSSALALIEHPTVPHSNAQFA